MDNPTEYKIYTPEQITEFLLNNSLNPEESRRAVAVGLTLRVDPLAL